MYMGFVPENKLIRIRIRIRINHIHITYISPSHALHVAPAKHARKVAIMCSNICPRRVAVNLFANTSMVFACLLDVCI